MTHPARLCEELPDAVGDDAGVLLEPLAIAVHSIDRVAPTGGSAVVVLGAGPIGLTHTMLLARGGVTPLIVTDVLDYRLAAAKAAGATLTLNPRRDDVHAAVMDATGGEGADFVFECAGVAETFQQMIDLAAPAGRVGVVGIPEDNRLAFTHSIARRKGLDVLMVRRANLTARRALQWALNPSLNLAALATHHWPMDRVQDAFQTCADYRDGVIKAIVKP
jgi:L-iditol 2-dehydrogenase